MGADFHFRGGRSDRGQRSGGFGRGGGGGNFKGRYGNDRGYIKKERSDCDDGRFRKDPRGERGHFRGSRRGDRVGGFRGDRGSGRAGYKSGDRAFGSDRRGNFRGGKGDRGGSRGGFRGGRAGRGRGGSRRGLQRKFFIERHRHDGVFIARGKDEALLTRNLVPGNKVYKEKLITVEDDSGKCEYRTWNPFRSKLGAAIVGGIGNIHMKRGSRVLYLGAASGTTVSHVSDIVGPEGYVYAVEFSLRSGRDLVCMAQRRKNVLPIIEDARHPLRYRIVMPMVDVIFSDVAQPDQARILALNAQYYLKHNGYYIISIKANCIDSTADPQAVIACEIEKLRKFKLKPLESLTLEPYERDHTIVVGIYKHHPDDE